MVKKHCIKINLKSYDYTLINKSVNQIIFGIKKTGSVVTGPISLPTHIKKFTILSSPHVDKKARDQYEIRTYKKLIIIINPQKKTLNLLMQLNLIAGVIAKISVI